MQSLGIALPQKQLKESSKATFSLISPLSMQIIREEQLPKILEDCSNMQILFLCMIASIPLAGRECAMSSKIKKHMPITQILFHLSQKATVFGEDLQQLGSQKIQVRPKNKGENNLHSPLFVFKIHYKSNTNLTF